MGAILRFLSALSPPPPRLHTCQWRDPKPNRHPVTYYNPACETAGQGWQTNFLSSTIMQSNKGAWCQVAGQPARRICRTSLDLLVIMKAICNPTYCHQWSCVLVISYISKYTLKSDDFVGKDYLLNKNPLALLVFSVIMSWIQRACCRTCIQRQLSCSPDWLVRKATRES